MSANPSPISLLSNDVGTDPALVVDAKTVQNRVTYRFFKRCFDVMLSLVFLAGLGPLWLLLAIFIKLDSKGPVFFVNRAIGQDGVEFPLYKFRSMHFARNFEVENSDVLRNALERAPTGFVNGRPVYKTALVDKHRITRAGRLLRRTSLDELPQLWNILRGDMSFVGPRPPLPREAALYKGWQRQRLLVKPGLTGLYQATARNRVPVEEMVRIDLEYIRRQSFWLDLKILFRTPQAMFSGL
jgi:lipopolysaccharide/colanic/teichoic acid biosynthesis glycosyltransferase